jgi:PAS domain S-box-containing protein
MPELTDEQREIIRHHAVDEGAYRALLAMMEACHDSTRSPGVTADYFDIAPVLLIALDAEGRIAEINQTACDMLGLTREEALNRDWFEQLLPERVRPAVRQVFEQLMSGQEADVRYYENTILTGGGEERLIAWHNSVIRRDDNGQIVGVYSAGEDITEQRLADQRLQESEERYRRLVELSPDAIVVHQNGRVVFLNRRGAEMFGAASADELLGRQILDLVHPDFRAMVAARVEAITAQHSDSPLMEGKLLRLDGTTFYAELSSATISSDGVPAIQSIIRNIEDRKQAEEALREAEKAYRTVADFTYDWEYWEEPDRTLRYVSPACQRITGYAAEEFLRNPALLYEITHEADRQLWDVHHHSPEETLTMREVQFRIRRQDGEVRWIEHACRPVIDDEGNYLGTRVSNRDVTRRKHTEMELRRTEATLRALLDSAFQLYTLIDTDYRLIDANRAVKEAALDIHGREMLPGAPIWDFVLPGDREGFEQNYQAALAGEIVITEKVIPGASHTHHYEVAYYPVRASDGRIIGVCMSTRDISEQKAAAQHKLELEIEKERSRILAEFVQNASHEFRTPLSQIALDAYFLGLPGEAARRERYLERIKQQTDVLGSLVDRLVQSVELGSTDAADSLPFDLNGLLARVIDTYEAAAFSRGLKIWRQLDGALPECLGDEARLTLVFGSLLDNAIRYTPQGEITVRSRLDGERLLVEVQDTGQGIRPEDVPHIFDRFFREDRSHTTEGFGLGLSIARRIVELHGGEITVQSVRGKGSTFQVWLPVAVEQ